MRRRFVLLPILLAVSLLALAWPVAANHPQSGVTFRHDGGNEWWVEVQLGGSYADWWAPSVRDTNGEWKTMTRPSWAPNPGFYVASYRVEPGHQVQFRLENRGTYLLSCWFDHPSGVERCDGTEAFSATFRPGPHAQPAFLNTWVDANHPVQAVYAEVYGEGYYMNMEKGPEGDWRLGTTWVRDLLFRFVAWSALDGSTVTSGCFRYGNGEAVPCPPRYDAVAYMPHTSSGNWSNMTAHVSYVEAPAKVQVRFDGGEFRDMARVDSSRYRITGAPSTGDHVAQFRLVAPDGRVACSEEGWHWPSDEYYSKVGASREAVFANAKGNENWVQVNAYSWSSVVAVEAEIDGVTRQPLKLQSWCDWGAAIHAPKGTNVRFWAFFEDLSYDVSEYYIWPPAGDAPEPPPPTGSFDASFHNVKGNAWWIQAGVSASGGELAKVEVRLNSGNWLPLDNKGWAWAKSYHAPEGTFVQFRATSTTGQTDLSNCYRWTNAMELHYCLVSPPPPPPPSSFDATFKNPRGNNWWVEVDVSATGGTLAGVDARVNGGAWTALSKTSWGSWAKSMGASTGSTVEFRARAADGATDVSSGYRWPPS